MLRCILKGKGCFVFLIVVAVAITAAAKIFLPSFISSKQYALCYAEASALFSDGKIVDGAGKLTEGLIVAGGYQALSTLDKGAVVSLVHENALKVPEQSIHLLEFLSANAIEIECDDRAVIYMEFLKHVYSTYVKTGRGGSDGAMNVLFLTAAWSGTCGVDTDNLKIYKQVFDIYKKEAGDGFVKLPWMDAAYAGKPVSINGGAPVVKPVNAVTAVQAPSAAAVPPADAAMSDGVKDAVGEAEKAKAAAAQTPVKAEKVVPAKKDDKAAGGNLGAKDSKSNNSIIDKLKEIKQSEGGAYNAFEVRLKAAASDISRELLIKGVKNKDVYFSSSGKMFMITFQTSAVGEKDTWNSTMLIFETVHGAVKLDGGIPLERMSVVISDLSGAVEGTVGVNYSDYLSYKNGKINGNELAARMTLD